MRPDIRDAAGGAPDPSTGAIHDIGYRHFSGTRLGRGYIRRSLFVDSLRGAYGIGRSGRSKIMPTLLFAVTCLPALGIVAVTALTGGSELVGSYPSYLLNLQVVIAIFVAAQAPVAVSRDLRFRVTTLYFSRPLERVDYVTSKFAAMAAALFVLTGAPLVIMFAGALVVGLPPGDQLPDFPQALAGAALLSLILAGIGLTIAAVTPRRGLAVAAVIAVLIVSAGVQAASVEIAFAEGTGEAAQYLGLLSPFTLVDGVQSALLGAPTPLPAPPDTATGLIFAVVSLGLIAGCYLALLLRYRSVSVS